MKLDVNYKLAAAPGILVYRSNEYSFDTIDRVAGGLRRYWLMIFNWRLTSEA